MLAKLDRILNWGWTPDLHGAIQVRRVRTLVSAGVLLILVGVPFLIRAAEWHVATRLVTVPCAIALAFVGLVLLRLFQTDSGFHLSAHLITLGLFIGAVGSVVSSGGLASVNQAWLLLVPLLAGIALGLRSALIWGFAILLCVMLVGYLQLHGSAFPNQTPPAYRQSQNLLQVIGVMLGLLALIYSFLGHLGYSERMLADQNRQLQQQILEKETAEREAREAEQAKIRFLGNMSHEMRTPLNAIIGFAGRLQKSLDGRLDAREDLALQRIAVSGRRMLELVDDLFVLSAIDSGSFALNCCEVDPGQLLQAVYQEQVAHAAARNVALRVEQSDAASVSADPARLSQVLSSLVRYGLHCTRQGSVAISAFDTSGGEVCLQIEDTAPVMSERVRARLFDRYNHLHSTGEGDMDKSGLALALAGELVQLHGGRIEVTATADGNRYQVLLPPHAGRGRPGQ